MQKSGKGGIPPSLHRISHALNSVMRGTELYWNDYNMGSGTNQSGAV